MPIVAKAQIAAQKVAAAPVVRPDVRPRTRVRLSASDPSASTAPDTAAAAEPDAQPPVSEADAKPKPKPKPGDQDYTGKGHPPFKYRYQPGVSGNYKGRPKGSKGLRTIVREVMEEKVVAKTASGQKRMSKAEALFRKKVARAFDDKPGCHRAAEGCEALYKWAVPDEATPTAAAADDRPLEPEQMSAVDKATLAAYAKMVRETPGEEE